MIDPKTGIHEATVIIPWWLDCRDPKHNGLIPVYSRAPKWMTRFIFEYWRAVKGSK